MKLEITIEQLREMLLQSYEAGCSGMLALKEEVVEEIIQKSGLKEKKVRDCTSSYYTKDYNYWKW